MTNYEVVEGSGRSVRSELETNPDIVVGDTIAYISNNQQGYEKYRVISGADGNKSLKLIDSYDHQMGDIEYEEEEEEDKNENIGNKRKRSNSSSSTANYEVVEGSGRSVESELETNKKILVGDTIEYISNNQQGYMKYRVVLDKTGNKALKLIDSYDHQMGDIDYDDEEINGGKKRKRKVAKKKTAKRKTTKRKTTKRKTTKRKGGK
jgi:hypothetical protein